MTALRTQADLFDADRAYHRTDPDTSAKAAETAKIFVGRHYRVIIRALRTGWPVWHEYDDGMTSLEIAAHTNLEYLQVVRRLSELERGGKIYKTGTTRPNPNGRRATVWSARA